jgi:hypothetical protein
MATLDSIVDALLPDFYSTNTRPDTSRRVTRLHSMQDLLMLGDYEQHLTAITSGSSSAVYAVSPLVCAQPMCEPTLLCGDCKFSQQYVLRVYHMKGVCLGSRTDSHAPGERSLLNSKHAQHEAWTSGHNLKQIFVVTRMDRGTTHSRHVGQQACWQQGCAGDVTSSGAIVPNRRSCLYASCAGKATLHPELSYMLCCAALSCRQWQLYHG